MTHAAPAAERRPHIGRHFRLQWEAAQSAWVLLYPEGMVRLNQSGGEILRRCDGKIGVAQLVADLEKLFEVQGLEADVTAFLGMAEKQGWVEWT